VLRPLEQENGCPPPGRGTQSGIVNAFPFAGIIELFFGRPISAGVQLWMHY